VCTCVFTTALRNAVSVPWQYTHPDFIPCLHIFSPIVVKENASAHTSALALGNAKVHILTDCQSSGYGLYSVTGYGWYLHASDLSNARSKGCATPSSRPGSCFTVADDVNRGPRVCDPVWSPPSLESLAYRTPGSNAKHVPGAKYAILQACAMGVRQNVGPARRTTRAYCQGINRITYLQAWHTKAQCPSRCEHITCQDCDTV